VKVIIIAQRRVVMNIFKVGRKVGKSGKVHSEMGKNVEIHLRELKLKRRRQKSNNGTEEIPDIGAKVTRVSK
jgi:hypothetical protein